VDVMFNLSASVDGWIELMITELALHHRQRISIDVNSSTVHILTTATQVFVNKLISCNFSIHCINYSLLSCKLVNKIVSDIMNGDESIPS